MELWIYGITEFSEGTDFPFFLLPPSESMSAAVRQCLSELNIALTLARQVTVHG